jgi:hypothetical protein
MGTTALSDPPPALPAYAVTEYRADESTKADAADNAPLVVTPGAARHDADQRSADERPAERTVAHQGLRHTLADPDAADAREWHSAHVTERLELDDQAVCASRDEVADDVRPAITPNQDAPADGELWLQGLSSDDCRVE